MIWRQLIIKKSAKIPACTVNVFIIFPGEDAGAGLAPAGCCSLYTRHHRQRSSGKRARTPSWEGGALQQKSHLCILRKEIARAQRRLGDPCYRLKGGALQRKSYLCISIKEIVQPQRGLGDGVLLT